jgi:hypothetical protein
MKKVIAAGIVWPNALIIFTLIWLKTGPIVEQWLSPMLTEQSIENVTRSGGTVCWRWKWRKVHDAVPAGSAWSFTLLGTGLDYPTVVARQQDGQVLSSELRNRSPGPAQSAFCAQIPSTLAKVSGLRIEGAIAYTPAHRLWSVWQPVEPVEVPPPDV